MNIKVYDLGVCHYFVEIKSALNTLLTQGMKHVHVLSFYRCFLLLFRIMNNKYNLRECRRIIAVQVGVVNRGRL